MLGKLGGHLGRKGDGEPGVLVLWRGWMWLYESVEMTARHHPESWSGIRRNAVMAWNTMKMQSVLDWNTRRSTAVPPEMIGRIASTRTEGINLRGLFTFPIEQYRGQLLPSLAAAKSRAFGGQTALQNAAKRRLRGEQNAHYIQQVSDVPGNFAHVFTDKVPAYMDAPVLPSAFSGSEPQVEIAAIHSASLCDAWPRALMEYAG